MRSFKLNRVFAVILLLLGATIAYAFSDGQALTKPSGNTSSKPSTILFANSSTKPSVNPPAKISTKLSTNSATTPSDKPLAKILQEKGFTGSIPNLKIVVDKSDRLLTLYSGSTFLKSYRVAIGDGGLEDKEKAGDHKTPEGMFYITERSAFSQADPYLGSRWMRLSYPNVEDAKRGLRTGLIDQETYQEIVNANDNRETPPQRTALGGGVGIHGGHRNGINKGDAWTWGCVALTNSEANEIYDYITIGTEVYIKN